ncbi:MAG: DUF4058 family protein [Planctomycetes bacterium]|nr:DUF4058 family protein [Planctomycetota bacterium]
MDPWLESPTEWPGFHDILVIVTVELLQPRLRQQGYYANPGERVWLTQPERSVYPDVAVIRRQPAERRGDRTSAAVIEVDEPIRVQRSEVEVHEGFVDIVDAAGHRVITSIEFLSPTNKLDTDGRKLYERKQQETRDAGVHLVEIDLIRRGPHVLEVPPGVVERLRPWDYLVNLVRREADEYEVYPIRLRDRLPRIRVPLKMGDEDAVLDLQEAVERAYEIGPYQDRLDYTRPPMPPLSDDDARWADELLKDKGFRQ